MVVRCNGETGLLYRNGQTLIGFGEFEDMAPAYNNELWAKKDGLWGLIDLADAKQKAGVSSMLTVPADKVPDPDYIPYEEEKHPETTPFDYPAKMSQVYEFYQDYYEFQSTSESTTLYTSPDGGEKIITVPENEIVHIFGISQSNPGWLCVEWNVMVIQDGSNRIGDTYFGWISEENLLPYSNSVPDSAYQDILEQYRTLCALPDYVWSSGDYYEAEYPEVNIITVFQIQQEFGNLYYAYYDINRDGQDELLIGRGQLQEGKITMGDILAFNGSSLKSFNSHYNERGGGYIGDRADASICDDGTIVLFYSNSGSHGHYQFFEVTDSGYKKIGKEYDQDTRERPDATFFDGSGYITEAEMQSILDEYNYISNDAFEWVLLVKEKE